MERPRDITQLASVIDRLVTCGGARVPHEARPYLCHVGVAADDGENEWMWPTQHFLRYVLPAADSLDLLRRVALRDTQYRFYLDLSLCSVIHSVAVSERWKRFEELLFGQCNSIAPRLCQVLTWVSAHLNIPLREISPTKIQQVIAQQAEPSFPDWDRLLWGDSRGTVDLFPLLLDLYVPLGNHACHIGKTDDSNLDVVASLIHAAVEHGEGLSFPFTLVADLQSLQQSGLPIRVERGHQKLCAYLVGAIELDIQDWTRTGELEDVPAGLAESAKASRLLHSTGEHAQWSVQEPLALFAPISIDHDSTRWPTESLKDAPAWLSLPGSDVIGTAAKRRRDSKDADTALMQISRHPLYGFMLQLFVLEALDRELGEDTLALALPQNKKLETPADWAGTTVLYRPRSESLNATNSEREGFLVLGRFDDIIPIVAREVGLNGIATPYRTDDLPWSRAMYLMSTAGVVDGRPHSWRLTFTSFIIDRLHTGSLMKDVIRGGRGFRDRMHGALSELWKQQMANKSEAQIPA